MDQQQTRPAGSNRVGGTGTTVRETPALVSVLHNTHKHQDRLAKAVGRLEELNMRLGGAPPSEQGVGGRPSSPDNVHGHLGDVETEAERLAQALDSVVARLEERA